MNFKDFDDALKQKQYLGDGLYVGHDGFQIILYAERDGVHWVALEPITLKIFLEYVEGLKNAR